MPAQLARAELSRTGLHWEDLNEDISIAGLLRGYAQHITDYEPTAEELAGIDRGLQDGDEGRAASDEQFDAALTKLRGA